jgi:hypothetical protein
LTSSGGVAVNPAALIGSAQIIGGNIAVTATANTLTSTGTVVPSVPTGTTYVIQCTTSNLGSPGVIGGNILVNSAVAQ